MTKPKNHEVQRPYLDQLVEEVDVAIIKSAQDLEMFEINSVQTLAQYLGVVALNVPGALVKILNRKFM